VFAERRQELVACRTFAPIARHDAARLMADAGLLVTESGGLDLADSNCQLGRFGKLDVCKGERRPPAAAPRERMVPLVNDAGRTLRWLVVWGHCGDARTPTVRRLEWVPKRWRGAAVYSDCMSSAALPLDTVPPL
jgi:integrase/recombinase XerD